MRELLSDELFNVRMNNSFNLKNQEALKSVLSNGRFGVNSKRLYQGVKLMYQRLVRMRINMVVVVYKLYTTKLHTKTMLNNNIAQMESTDMVSELHLSY